VLQSVVNLGRWATCGAFGLNANTLSTHGPSRRVNLEKKTLITIRYFAATKDLAGCETQQLPAIEGESVGQLRQRLIAMHPHMRWLLSVSRLAQPDEFLQDIDLLPKNGEVLVFPPVSGGAPRAELRSTPIASGEVSRDLSSDGVGALITFEGIVRATNRDKTVTLLEYSAYEPLAVAEMERICQEAVSQFGLIETRLIHRVGALHVGDLAVSIAVMSAHRAEAFDGCRYIIEQLKARVPIWKREISTDGEEWLGSTP